MSIGKTHGGGSTVARVERGEGFMVFFFPQPSAYQTEWLFWPFTYMYVAIFNKHQCNMYVQAN